jgi:flagellar biosynthesis protein FlhB
MVPIMMIVMFLIVAGIAHVAVNIMSPRANFKKMLSLLAFCGLIPMIEQIVGAAVIAATGLQEKIPAVWPGALMDSWGEIAAIVMVALLSIFMYR